jgi:hypothetical protein
MVRVFWPQFFAFWESSMERTVCCTTNPTCLVLQPSDKEIPKEKITLTFPIDYQFELWG